jgi:2-isopropylmalate synthase
MKVFTLDNTFRHHAGRAALSFTLADRLAIVRALDDMGIDYAEMGCPGASASTRKFFDYARADSRLAHARLAGSARLEFVSARVEHDDELRFLLEAGTPTVILAGSGWHAGSIGTETYCLRIREAVAFLKQREREVIFRDEDFFRSYTANADFALRMLESAKEAGADILCLGDSSASGIPRLIGELAHEVRKRFDGVLGICAHDDSDLALANTLEAVEQGFTLVEGSMNAYGARRGLANLCSIISNLEHYMGHNTIGPHGMEEMPRAARLVADAMTNAFGRRGPMHPPHEPAAGTGLLDDVDPALLARLTENGTRALKDRIQILELENYDLRTAGGTLELLVREAIQPEIRPFIAERFELTAHSGLYGGAVSSATATVRIGENIRCETEDGDGPVNALERCLRQCLFAVYPEIANLHILDYRMQLAEAPKGTSSRVRVWITWSHAAGRWVTLGVSGDLLDAVWRALIDGFQLLLMRQGRTAPVPVDSSWAV